MDMARNGTKKKTFLANFLFMFGVPCYFALLNTPGFRRYLAMLNTRLTVDARCAVLSRFAQYARLSALSRYA